MCTLAWSTVLMTRMCDRPTWVEFSHTFINVVANWSEMKTCQTSLLDQFFTTFRQHVQTFARKTEIEWQIIARLMMVISYVKRTASGKTEQCNANCDGKTKTLLQNSSSFKELLVNKGLKSHIRQVISLLTKKECLMCTMSSFLTF